MELNKIRVSGGIFDVYLVVEENNGFTVAEFYKHSLTEDYNTVGRTKTYQETLELIKKHSGEVIIKEEVVDITW
jgi:hypothetical protein